MNNTGIILRVVLKASFINQMNIILVENLEGQTYAKYFGLEFIPMIQYFWFPRCFVSSDRDVHREKGKKKHELKNFDW